MPTFALVLYLAAAGGAGADVFVLDTGLTMDDCRSALAGGVVSYVDQAGMVVRVDPLSSLLTCQMEG